MPELILSMKFINPFQSSVVFYIEISHFALQNKWLVSIWNELLGWNGLSLLDRDLAYDFNFHRIMCACLLSFQYAQQWLRNSGKYWNTEQNSYEMETCMKLSMSAVSFLPQLDSKMVFSLELMDTFSLWVLFKQLSYMLFIIIFIHVLVAPYLSIGRSTVYGVNLNLKNIRRNKLRHKLKSKIFVNLNRFLVSISILYPLVFSL